MAQWMVENFQEVPHRRDSMDICLQECWRGEEVSTGRSKTLGLTAEIPSRGLGRCPRYLVGHTHREITVWGTKGMTVYPERAHSGTE